ncbi:MAG: hypothetical protein M1834_008335 [Cirrosporium novae-zelandiae]|nr:MAG: hypothetical protein M1834_008335 [Cirrosporium novae-zelandiae]
MHPRNNNLPRILCLHGGGASATIFYVQTLKLQIELRRYFHFVFVNGPMDSQPGPGVLPIFEGAGPYFKWVTDVKVGEGTEPSEKERKREEKAVEKIIEKALAEDDGGGPFVGVMGFSQGSRVAAGLLLQQQTRKASQLEKLQFGIFFGATWPPIAAEKASFSRSDMTNEISDNQVQSIRIPTLHVQGLQDPWLAESRMLLANCCEPKSARLVEFEGGHHLPLSTKDIKRVANMILWISKPALSDN